MKTLAIFLLFMGLFQTAVFGQEKENLTAPKFVIYTSVFDYLPDELNSANFNLGLDIPFREDQSIYFNLGFIHSYGPSNDFLSVTAEKNIGLNFRTELKKYHNTKTGFLGTLREHIPLFPNSGAYHSFEMFSQYTRTNRNERASGGKNLYHVNRFALGLQMNVGYKVVGKSGFSRDFTIGMGAQLVHSFSENRSNDDRAWPNQEKEGLIFSKLFDHGTAVLPFIKLRLKLGWSVFNKR